MIKALVALFAAITMMAVAPAAYAEKKKPKCPEGMIYKPSTNKCVWPSGSF
jgi:hypothetical protein